MSTKHHHKKKLWASFALLAEELVRWGDRLLSVTEHISIMTDFGHVVLVSIILATFIGYVAIDVFACRLSQWWNWPFALLAVSAAVYWFIGFLSKHHIPSTPLLPDELYPTDWGYMGLAAILFLYGILDLANLFYHNRRHFKAGLAVMVVFASVAISLMLTLRGPQGG